MYGTINHERVTRKLVKIDCPTCSYPKGIKNEQGKITCGMCGEKQ